MIQQSDSDSSSDEDDSQNFFDPPIDLYTQQQ